MYNFYQDSWNSWTRREFFNLNQPLLDIPKAHLQIFFFVKNIEKYRKKIEFQILKYWNLFLKLTCKYFFVKKNSHKIEWKLSSMIFNYLKIFNFYYFTDRILLHCKNWRHRKHWQTCQVISLSSTSVSTIPMTLAMLVTSKTMLAQIQIQIQMQMKMQ